MPPQTPTAAPLWRVLAITFLLSVGTGSITQGLYFIADAGCGFDRTSQFLLGVLMGGIYIPAALATGPILRRIEARDTRLSPRAILAALVTTGGLAALIPPTLGWLGHDPCWSIWLVAGIYALSTGPMWPTVEWYLAGGRKHQALRAATGRFNVVWTSAIVACFWLLSPFLERAPLDVLAVLAILHALGLALVLGLPPRPAPHLDHDDPHPPIYEDMLKVTRRLLPISYLLMSVLGPYFPSALRELGVETRWQPVVASVWFTSRVAAMVALERWHGWHSRWATLITGAATLVVGFVGAVLAPQAGSLPLMIASLAVFGVGMGIIYTAALYYALEVGGHSADAGGTHEALIGMGYTLGPAIGFAASLAVAAELVQDAAFSAILIGTAITLSLLGYAISSQYLSKTK